MARNIIVINVDLRETRVALIEDGVIAELHIERAAHRSTVGHIILGKVTRVLPGMQAAFIDVGQERAAFLHVEDLIRPDDFDAYLAADPRLDKKDVAAQPEENVEDVPAHEAPVAARRGRRRRGRGRRGGASTKSQAQTETDTEQLAASSSAIVETTGEAASEDEPRNSNADATELTPSGTVPEEVAPEPRTTEHSPNDTDELATAELEPRELELDEPDIDADADEEYQGPGATLRAAFGVDDELAEEDLEFEDEDDNDDEPSNLASDIALDEEDELDDDADNEFEEDGELDEVSTHGVLDEGDGDSSSDDALDSDDDALDSDDDEFDSDDDALDSDDDALESSATTESSWAEEITPQNNGNAADISPDLEDATHTALESTSNVLPTELGSSSSDANTVESERSPNSDVEALSDLGPSGRTRRRRRIRPRRDAESEADLNSEEVPGDAEGAAEIAETDDTDAVAGADGETETDGTPNEEQSARRGRRRRRRRGRDKEADPVDNSEREEDTPLAAEGEQVGRQSKRRRRRRRRRGSEERNDVQSSTTAENDKNAKGQNGRRIPSRVSRSVPITEVVKEGDHVVVQISKEPIGTKGARVTSHVSLPGRYVVYLPTVEHVGISKRIGNAPERSRLRKTIDGLKPETGGLIVRTVAEGLTKKQLKADIGYLIKVWAEVAKNRRSAKPKDILYEELDLVLKVARDFFTDGVDHIVIDDRDQYGRLARFVEMFLPERVKDIKLYAGEDPIFDAYGIEDEIKRALSRKVPLPSGGSLIMDQAEALTAIDVNTGRYVGKGSKDLEETALKTNLEAVDEIAYQLRFRNIGGLVILDLIDMEKAGNRNKVWRALEQRLAKDKAKTTINRISELGLIEMTRKRTRESLGRIMHEPCFYCDGTGHIQSRETIAYEILRQIGRDRLNLPGYSVRIHAHPAVVDFLKFEAKDALLGAERRYTRRIELNARQEYHIEQYDLQGH